VFMVLYVVEIEC